MTAINSSRTDLIRRTTRRELARQWAVGLARLARPFKADIAQIAAAGQLGPDPETETGRWTGARV
jgi:hypothetical protein